MNDDLNVPGLFPTGCPHCSGREFERDDMIDGHVKITCASCKTQFGGTRIGEKWFRLAIVEARDIQWPKL